MISNFVPTDYFSPSNSIPSTYLNGYSEAEELAQLVTYVNGLYGEYVKVEGISTSLTQAYETLSSQVNQMLTELNDYKVSDIIFQKIMSDVKTKLELWISTYIYELHRFVSFGLEDGYFVVYIPKAWEDIAFDTGVTNEDYGKLILKFN